MKSALIISTVLCLSFVILASCSKVVDRGCVKLIERVNEESVSASLVAWADALKAKLETPLKLERSFSASPGEYAIEEPFDVNILGYHRDRLEIRLICNTEGVPIGVFLGNGERRGVVIAMSEDTSALEYFAGVHYRRGRIYVLCWDHKSAKTDPKGSWHEGVLPKRSNCNASLDESAMFSQTDSVW